MPIKILPPELINKIAAGEVVERPASVVKELIENSIDAGATIITVELQNGGLDLIKIIDNGSGMPTADARLALERYATSKISEVDDLYSLQSFGFRGEALSSISEVSMFELQTRHNQEQIGIIIKRANGQTIEQEAGLPIGTTISITSLFYNIPARKKFMKAANTELSHIIKIVTDFALIYPQITFSLTHNSKKLFHYNTADQWINRVKEVLGRDLSTDLIVFNHQKNDFKISGFASSPSTALDSKNEFHIFVNNRPIKDAIIYRAITEAYKDLIPKNKQPLVILKIDINPRLVDVNVHPRKSEVKFIDGQMVFHEVFSTLKYSLTNDNQTALLNNQTTNPTHENSTPLVWSRQNYPAPKQFSGWQFPQKKPNSVSTPYKNYQPSLNINNSEKILPTPTNHLKLIGQIKNSYLLVEAPDRLIIIDQHAAGEGILWKKLQTALENLTDLSSQQLLTPTNIELSPILSVTLKNNLGLINHLGFDVAEFGNNSFVINAIPAILTDHDPKQLVIGLAEDLNDDLDFKKLSSEHDKKRRLLKYAACRGAIKFNDKLDSLEQQKLLDDITNLKVTSCAHGRPISFELDFEELNHQFQR